MIRKVLHIDSGFDFEAGGHVGSADLVYYTSARERRPDDKVVWVCHALTGNADPTDWWKDLFGPGLLFDPDRYFVVCAAMIGSAYGEFGPTTINPETGKPYLLDFPATTVRDIVSANILVRKHLGIEKIDILLGPSIGGYQAAEWLVMEPDVISKAALIAMGFRVTPFLTAFNESQRMAIEADPTFFEAKSVEGGLEGLKCARSIALISYRTPAGYDLSQQDPDEDTLFASRSCTYQRHQGDKFVARQFDAYSYWYLSKSLDSMNLGRGRGGVVKALSSIKAEVILVSITSDQLFSTENLKMAAEAIPNSSYHEIQSIFGHDGFLIEKDQLISILEPLTK